MPWIALAAPPSVATTIDVEVTALSADPVERDVRVDVPDGMHVVAMEIESGGVRTRARQMAAADATARFLRVVGERRDPALLEQADDRVVLHVFPVMRDRPLHATLTLARDAGVVDTTSSLYAETPPPPHGRAPHVIIDLCGVPTRDTSLDAHEIRAVVQLHEPQLRRCYDVALQRHPTLAGTAELHFVVGAGGAVESSAVDGALPSTDVDACLAHEVATWTFRAGDRPVVVNYPLAFEPPR